MANIEDVARLARVSKGTVSNVFTQKRPVREEVVERVLQAAKELNFRPNYWARTLSTKETRILGLTMRSEQTKFSQFSLNLVNGVLQVCYANGYRLLVNTLSPEHAMATKYRTTDPIDGEILLDPEQDDVRLIHRSEYDPPVVVIGQPRMSSENRFCYVDNDNCATAEQVTTYLLELGHRQILFLNTSRERTVSTDRQAGFERAYRERGLAVPAEYCQFRETHMTSLDYGFETIRRLVATNFSFTAVIADSDKVALGVYRALAEFGLSIPGDVSVFAFSDDSVFAPEFHPPLSGVALNSEELGREAASLLLDCIQDATTPVSCRIVPTKLVIRDSCRALDPLITLLGE